VSDAVGFLIVPGFAAVAGSLVIWLVSRSRRPTEPGFGEQMRRLAPDAGTQPYPQPTGIVTLDDQPGEEG